MENFSLEPTVESSNIDKNIKLITQQREMRDISSQNGSTDERKKEIYNVSVKSVEEAKLPLDIDEYEKSLISLGECYFNTKFDKYK